MELVTPAGRESDAERRSGDRPAALYSCGEPALCYSDLSDAALWARACHPAYSSRIRFPVRPGEPSATVENC